MSEFREPAYPPEELRVIEALGELPSVRPDPAYRSRISRAFATGSLKSSVRQRSLFASAALWGSVAAAATLVAGAFFLNRGPDWRVMEVSRRSAWRL